MIHSRTFAVRPGSEFLRSLRYPESKVCWNSVYAQLAGTGKAQVQIVYQPGICCNVASLGVDPGRAVLFGLVRTARFSLCAR